MRDHVDGVGVGGQQHGLRVHQLLPDHDLLRRRRSECPQAFADGDLTDHHHLVEIGLDAPVELELAQQPLTGVAVHPDREKLAVVAPSWLAPMSTMSSALIKRFERDSGRWGGVGTIGGRFSNAFPQVNLHFRSDPLFEYLPIASTIFEHTFDYL